MIRDWKLSFRKLTGSMIQQNIFKEALCWLGIIGVILAPMKRTIVGVFDPILLLMIRIKELIVRSHVYIFPFNAPTVLKSHSKNRNDKTYFSQGKKKKKYWKNPPKISAEFYRATYLSHISTYPTLFLHTCQEILHQLMNNLQKCTNTE